MATGPLVAEGIRLDATLDGTTSTATEVRRAGAEAYARAHGVPETQIEWL